MQKDPQETFEKNPWTDVDPFAIIGIFVFLLVLISLLAVILIQLLTPSS